MEKHPCSAHLRQPHSSSEAPLLSLLPLHWRIYRRCLGQAQLQIHRHPSYFKPTQPTDDFGFAVCMPFLYFFRMMNILQPTIGHWPRFGDCRPWDKAVWAHCLPLGQLTTTTQDDMPRYEWPLLRAETVYPHLFSKMWCMQPDSFFSASPNTFTSIWMHGLTLQSQEDAKWPPLLARRACCLVAIPVFNPCMQIDVIALMKQSSVTDQFGLVTTGPGWQSCWSSLPFSLTTDPTHDVHCEQRQCIKGLLYNICSLNLRFLLGLVQGIGMHVLYRFFPVEGACDEEEEQRSVLRRSCWRFWMSISFATARACVCGCLYVASSVCGFLYVCFGLCVILL